MLIEHESMVMWPSSSKEECQELEVRLVTTKLWDKLADNGTLILLPSLDTPEEDPLRETLLPLKVLVALASI